METIYSRFRNLINVVFPPESWGERFIRTQYHRLAAHKAIVNWQIIKSKNSYPKWLKRQQRIQASAASNFSSFPIVTFILPIEEATLSLSIGTVKSIQCQLISQWQLILIESGDEVTKSELAANIGNDSRIIIVRESEQKLQGMMSNSVGQFVVCCAPGDRFSNALLTSFYSTFEDEPDADIFYYDCDEQDGSSIVPFFKPSKISPELLLSVNYLSSSFIKKDVAERVGSEVSPNYDFAHQERELLFLLVENGASTKHIPQVLIHKVRTNDNNQQTMRVIQAHLTRMRLENAGVEISQKGVKASWESKQPLVSIIIPTKNNLQVLKTLIDSMLTLTDYPKYEILFVDNASDDVQTRAFYASLGKEPRIRVIPFNEPFNYSRAVNLGAAKSNGELLLFLNDDMKVLHPDWLKELAQWALVPQIGVVGTKLLRPNRSIQHAGVVIGLQGFMGHLYLNTPEHYYGLLGSVDWYRNVSAVTGACQMFRRSVFEELGGYDEQYHLVFSDVDICLRAIQKGYRILYNPFAELIHYEGRSRGYRSPLSDIVRAYDQMKDWLDDPYFSPNLTYTTIPECKFREDNDNDRMIRIEIRRRAIRNAYYRHGFTD
jgi:GT2 family glycosyltransferase